MPGDRETIEMKPVAKSMPAVATPFDDLGLAVHSREPLSHHTWLGIGGEARFFCEPVDVDALSRLVQRCRERGIALRVIGGGTVTLANAANTFNGVNINRLAATVTVTSGSGKTSKIGDVIELTATFAQAVNVVRGIADLAFQSRWSNLDDCIVLGCRLELDEEPPDLLTKRMQKQWIVERAEQPSGTRTVAMMFKDPHGTSAESLVVQSGARDLRVGEAMVYAAHANYVVASPQCPSEDVRGLVELVRTRVRERLGVELSPQIEVW